MPVKIPDPADYGLSAEYGFLPPQLPLELLPDAYYREWENIANNLPVLLQDGMLRDRVRDMPRLSTTRLKGEVEWRRAYVLLTFILQAYLWGGDGPLEVIPPCLSIPLLEISKHLDIPPVATVSTLCFWNFKLGSDSKAIENLDNLSSLISFTGSKDESWFYLVVVAIEARGACAIPLMLSAISSALLNNTELITEALISLAKCLADLTVILQRIYEHCEPQIFYHDIRPFIAGSKGMEDAGLPHGIIFDDGTKKREYRKYSGASNAQSALIQFIDIVLGVEHFPTGETKHRFSPSETGQTAIKTPESMNNFIYSMREYMPGPHRRFLEDVSAVANIRTYVENHRTCQQLCDAYDACLINLRTFRDAHLQVVTRYVIVMKAQAKKNANGNIMGKSPVASHGTALDSGKESGPKGTGGTALMPFLKQARNETVEKIIGSLSK